jgi:uncharacterized membrane protein
MGNIGLTYSIDILKNIIVQEFQNILFFIYLIFIGLSIIISLSIMWRPLGYIIPAKPK